MITTPSKSLSRIGDIGTKQRSRIISDPAVDNVHPPTSLVKEDLNRYNYLETAVNTERARHCSWEDGVIVLHPAFDFGVPSALVICDLGVAVRVEEREYMRLGNLSGIVDPSNLDGPSGHRV
jgi:hypothetical protein